MATKKIKELEQSTSVADNDVFIKEDVTSTKYITFLNLYNLIKTKLKLGSLSGKSKIDETDLSAELKSELDGKAKINHASNGTDYGVANATNYGHAKASGTTPKAPGASASPGNETGTFARGDHIHPLQDSVTGNAGTATILKIARYIMGAPFDGSKNVTNHGICSTAAYTLTKSANVMEGFALIANCSRVSLKFTYGSTSATMTLNVNGTGYKTVYYQNATTMPVIKANQIVEFVYDGTYWMIVGDVSQAQIDDLVSYEVVSNENGIAYKFKNGLAICILDKTANDVLFVKAGNVYCSKTAVVGPATPITLTVSARDIVFLVGGGYCWISQQNQGTTNAFGTTWIYTYNEGTMNVSLRYVKIGMWK